MVTTFGFVTNGRSCSCWMITEVRGNTNKLCSVGPESRKDGWPTSQRKAPTSMSGELNTIVSVNDGST